MSNNTHVNSYKQDAKDALAKAHAALGEAEVTIEKLVAKLEADSVPVNPPVNSTPSDAPVTPPVSETTPPAQPTTSPTVPSSTSK